MAKGIRIFWAPSENRYALESPHGGEAFLNDMRLFCSGLEWKHKEKVWLFDEDSLKDVLDICAAHFTTLTPKIEYRNTAKAQTATEISAANAAALAMFKACGPEFSKKVYNIMVKQYHPDTGVTPNHDTTAAITMGWRAVKEALGW